MAVDTVSPECRIVGEPRLARFATFLLQYFFPRHHALCWEEGRLMRICAVGVEAEKRRRRNYWVASADGSPGKTEILCILTNGRRDEIWLRRLSGRKGIKDGISDSFNPGMASL